MIRKYREHIMKSNNKNIGHFNYFVINWNEYKNLVLSLLNHKNKIVRWWSRRKFRINHDIKAAGKEIIDILPDHYIIRNTDGSFSIIVRTHAKYAKRLYYGFLPLWWLLHFLDWLIQNTFNPEFSFGFDTLLSRPDASTGFPTVDGMLYKYDEAGYTWSIIRGATSADSLQTNSAQGYAVFLRASTSPLWESLYRGIFLFNTSGLTSLATITDAVLSLNKAYASNQLGGNGKCCIVSSSPANNSNLSSIDYPNFGTVDMGNKTYASIVSGSGYQAFTLNQNGKDNISKTGVSKYGLRDEWDRANSFTGTFSVSAYVGFGCDFADQTGNTYDPKLEITYTLPLKNIAGSTTSASSISAALKSMRRLSGSSENVASMPLTTLRTSARIQATISLLSNVLLSGRIEAKMSGVSISLTDISCSLKIEKKLSATFIETSGILGIAGKYVNQIGAINSSTESFANIKNISSVRLPIFAVSGCDITLRLEAKLSGITQFNADITLHTVKAYALLRANISALLSQSGSISIGSMKLFAVSDASSAIVSNLKLIQGVKGGIDSGLSITSLLNEYDMTRGRIDSASQIDGSIVLDKLYKGNIFETAQVDLSIEVSNKLNAIIYGMSSLEASIKNSMKLSGRSEENSSILEYSPKQEKRIAGSLNSQSNVMLILKNYSGLRGAFQSESLLSLLIRLGEKLSGMAFISSINSANMSVEKRLSIITESFSQTELALKLIQNIQGSFYGESDISLLIRLIAFIGGQLQSTSELTALLTSYAFLSGQVDSELELNAVIKAIKDLLGGVYSESGINSLLRLNEAFKGHLDGNSHIYPNLKGPVYLRGVMNASSFENMSSKLGIYRPLSAEINPHLGMVGIMERNRNFDLVIGRFSQEN